LSAMMRLCLMLAGLATGSCLVLDTTILAEAGAALAATGAAYAANVGPFSGRRLIAAPAAPPPPPRSESVLRDLFGEGSVDPAAVADACSSDVEWLDMNVGTPAVGKEAVQALLSSKFPEGSGWTIERVSDGGSSGGITWHRNAGDERIGLRGTLYVELDEEGRICYAQEGCEPLFKPGEATEALLKAATANVEKPEKPPATFTPKTPTTAEGIVRYLWEEAYPNGADQSVALDLFSEDIVYQDFNYPKPFVGKAAVTDFLNAFDIPGLEFVPQRISQGDRGCCFTWLVKINGADGPQGISYYEVDGKGEVCFIRDIPAPSIKPPPLLSLATLFDPLLRVFKPRSSVA